MIEAVIETDRKLVGEERPELRQLLLLTILIKYLEDRGVFAQAENWFAQFHEGATCFFDVLDTGTPAELENLLKALEDKFRGDIFCLPSAGSQALTSDDLRNVLSTLIEGKTTSKGQRSFWAHYSFQHLPVEVLSHLYQHFAQHGQGAIYTPPFVASLLLDYAIPYEKMTGRERVFDPTCGSGVFLVGAFRRLVNHWRSQHNWQQPDVPTLKTILKRSIFGVELQKESLHLTAFSLALAICDFLKPNVIWNQLQFDNLHQSNLLPGDFFDYVERMAPSSTLPFDFGTNLTLSEPVFDVVIGNPPFMSSLTDAATRINKASQKLNKGRGRLPDQQVAYLVAEQSMRLLRSGGRLCLIQPTGLLYNEKARPFQRNLLASYKTQYILDFTSVRGLFKRATNKQSKIKEKLSVEIVEEKNHTADTKIIVLVMTKEDPDENHKIRHLTFRRAFSVEQQIGFELDHYDYHLVPQLQAISNPSVWRINILGGGDYTR